MQSFSVEQIPESARRVITHYEHLVIGQGKTVRCPYYRNPRSGVQRWGLNAFSGKGSAEEIEEELKIIQKLEGKDFGTMPEDQIRDIMKKRRIGIECSGFVAHVLDAWIWDAKRRHLFHVISFAPRSLWNRIASLLRPFTHINVATLINPRNAKEFFALQEFRPGDLIYFRGSADQKRQQGPSQIDHIIMVTSVERDEKNAIRRIWYAHSVREESGVGIKEGTIMITNPDAPLAEQQWREVPETGHTIVMRAIHEDYRAALRFFHPSFLP